MTSWTTGEMKKNIAGMFGANKKKPTAKRPSKI
jgi:hypothetical protein